MILRGPISLQQPGGARESKEKLSSSEALGRGRKVWFSSSEVLGRGRKVWFSSSEVLGRGVHEVPLHEVCTVGEQPIRTVSVWF